ncbi:hypothetical protein FOA52_000473 [Chlamydomonas sp. UWO 241]|nr:hypothetical protein FOA52_000473 [Chlamydomonas sp. UWO 241]
MSALRLRASVSTRSAPRVARRACVVMRAVVASGPTYAEAIRKADEVCLEGSVDECKAAWDAVDMARREEEFQVKRRMELMRKGSLGACESRFAREEAKKSDPLEKFCAENEDADECREFDD